MIYSFTSLDCFENCPHQGYHKYVLKTKFKNTAQQGSGIEDHKALAARLLSGTPLPAHLRSAEPLAASITAHGKPAAEVKFGLTHDLRACEFFADNVFLRGAIDVTFRWPPNAFVFDWKTGKIYEKDLQHVICAIATLIYFPDIEQVIAANLWTQFGKLGVQHTYARAELPHLWRRILNRVHEIEDMGRKNHYPKRPSPLCKWCPVTACEHNENRGLADA